jgi:hypothetical protein
MHSTPGYLYRAAIAIWELLHSLRHRQNGCRCDGENKHGSTWDRDWFIERTAGASYMSSLPKGRVGAEQGVRPISVRMSPGLSPSALAALDREAFPFLGDYEGEETREASCIID